MLRSTVPSTISSSTVGWPLPGATQRAGGVASSAESVRRNGPSQARMSARPSPVQPSSRLPWKYRTVRVSGPLLGVGVGEGVAVGLALADEVGVGVAVPPHEVSVYWPAGVVLMPRVSVPG